MKIQESDRILVEAVRQGQPAAWEQFIARFEGRLAAFIRARLADRSAVDDVVQETFLGMLTSLPNYDSRRSLESYLFSIAAHKLTDHLRRSGARPAIPLGLRADESSGRDLPGPDRVASSIARSRERSQLESTALLAALADAIDHCRRRGQWERLKCLELLFVRGQTNQETARAVGSSEQTVANYKFEFLARLQAGVRGQSLPQDVFPELYEKP